MMIKAQWKKIRATPVGRWLNVPIRLVRALPVAAQPLMKLPAWVAFSREDTNFTYELKPLNEAYLAHACALATGGSWQVARAYIEEAKSDRALAEHIISCLRNSPDRPFADLRADFHKRLGWYAVVRLMKPEVVVETGVDKGLGTVVLAAAVLKNGMGRVYGTDLNPAAGRLLSGPYATVSEIIRGDSIASLSKLNKIDLFINDSDHSTDYERREYEVIADKLTAKAIVLGDNSHASQELMRWAERNGWNFCFWKEEPLDHWYPGSGIGFAYHPKT